MKDRLKITIAIDDVNPLPDWRILGTPVEEMLIDLNAEYGAKFTLFMPSHYHNHPKTKLSDNKKWVNELEALNIFELAAHGHYHQTPDPKVTGEMEFAILNERQCIERLDLLRTEWNAVGGTPLGWRNPGWLCNPSCVRPLSEEFDYVALHREHNNGMIWPNTKMFFGCVDIQHDEIETSSGVVHFQSHIEGSWNKNVWNDENYVAFKRTLDFICSNYYVDFYTFSEL